jgi:ribosomal protein L11 methylase PrmA
VGADAAQLDTGSFRDRDGRIYLHAEGVFRGLSESALAAFRAVSQARFYQAYTDQGALVATREVPAEAVPLPTETREAWAGFLEHRRIPVVSYPYEWTFSMLKAAALLQLELTEAALREGYTLKDATPYNVQFDGGRPVFIDIASFEPLEEGAPWTGYRQFCEMFLFPLMLQAYKGLDFQPFMRSRMDGVGLQTAARLFGFRDRFRKGVLSHVWLQSKLDRRYGGTGDNLRSELKSAGFNRELILVNLRKLRKLVGRLRWTGEESEWGDYTQFHNYSNQDHQRKETFVEHCVRQGQARRVWDIGCNTGQFSRLAARYCEQVLATDIDHLAVERLYLDPQRPANILPLVQNVADPSPSWGWRLQERRDLPQRAQPDMVLCLALIHHVVITANVPLAEFIGWLAGVTDQLLIEYVSRDDDKVQTLLRNKQDTYWDYSREHLEQQLQRHFRIRDTLELRDGRRRLYWCQRAVETRVGG